MDKTNVSAEAIFLQAVRFLMASEKLNSMVMSLMKEDETFGQLYIVYIVNISFSCELFLKTLIADDKGRRPPTTHDLKVLFEKLDPSLKADIKARVASGISQKNFDFQRDLETSNKSFDNWRYVYENPIGLEARIKFLQELARVIEQILLAEHPDWLNPFKATFKA